MATTVDEILKPWQHFGVNLGLERIINLLEKLGNPQDKVPIVHVAGSNGKGSVCAYLSSILKEAGYRVGRYTSPHLISWTERICIDEIPIEVESLKEVLTTVIDVTSFCPEKPTQFEIITAAAWYYFAQERVDIAVIEVGLGGRLDATNVCPHPLATVITSISREHWQTLGPTIADISREKAGILKPHCPAVVGILPREAEEVIAGRIAELNCPAVWVNPAIKVTDDQVRYGDINYRLPLLGEVQLINSALAIAVCNILNNQGWAITNLAIKTGLEKTEWLGRIQWVNWAEKPLLIDGAHNSASSLVLRNYVDTLGKSVRWVMGILETKDHHEMFQALLKPEDELYLVPVPDHKSAAPEYLADLAKEVCPNLAAIKTFPDLFTALDHAQDNQQEKLLVLCGSLYLIGYFLAQLPIDQKRTL